MCIRDRLSGGTGLGKTFLSACIAREVSDAGFSVVYDTAISVFSRYEDAKFRPDEVSDADVRRCESCDLLILSLIHILLLVMDLARFSLPCTTCASYSTAKNSTRNAQKNPSSTYTRRREG